MRNGNFVYIFVFLLDMGVMTSVKTKKAPARSKFYTPKANGWVKSQILTFCNMSFEKS